MLTDRGEFDEVRGPFILSPRTFERQHDPNPLCEECQRSIVTRFGEEIPPAVCDSCEDDWQRFLKQTGGRIEVVQEDG